MSINETCFPVEPADILPDGTPCIQGFCNKVCIVDVKYKLEKDCHICCLCRVSVKRPFKMWLNVSGT